MNCKNFLINKHSVFIIPDYYNWAQTAFYNDWDDF